MQASRLSAFAIFLFATLSCLTEVEGQGPEGPSVENATNAEGDGKGKGKGKGCKGGKGGNGRRLTVSEGLGLSGKAEEAREEWNSGIRRTQEMEPVEDEE